MTGARGYRQRPARDGLSVIPVTWGNKNEILERMNSVSEIRANGSFDSVAPAELYTAWTQPFTSGSYTSQNFVSSIEFIRSKLSFLFAHVAGVGESAGPPRMRIKSGSLGPVCPSVRPSRARGQVTEGHGVERPEGGRVGPTRQCLIQFSCDAASQVELGAVCIGAEAPGVIWRAARGCVTVTLVVLYKFRVMFGELLALCYVCGSGRRGYRG